MNQNSMLAMQGAQTTKIIYVGPKAVKVDTVSGFRPQLRFLRNEPTDTPVFVAQALLSFDCFVDGSEANIAAVAKYEEAQAIEAELAKKALEAELEKEKQLLNTVITVDGEAIDVLKLSFAQIETVCLAQELDVTRLDGEDKPSLAVRVREAYEAKSPSESEK